MNARVEHKLESAMPLLSFLTPILIMIIGGMGAYVAKDVTDTQAETNYKVDAVTQLLYSIDTRVSIVEERSKHVARVEQQVDDNEDDLRRLELEIQQLRGNHRE